MVVVELVVVKLVGRYLKMIGLMADIVLLWVVARFDLSSDPTSRSCAVSGMGPS